MGQRIRRDDQIRTGEVVGPDVRQGLVRLGRMGDEHAQGRREPVDLGLPVGDQRCGDHEQGGTACDAGALLQREQERQDLHGLAEPHVVGQAGAQSERLQEREPAHAHRLIRPQLGAEPAGQGRLAQSLGPAQAVERFLQPGAGHHFGPRRGLGRGPGGARAHRGARQETHALDEAEPVLARRRLHALPVGERLVEARRVQLHPLPPDQREAGRGRGDAGDLRGGQRLAVERHPHVEVEQRVRADPARRARAEGDLHLRSRRALGGPPVGHPHHHARCLEGGDVAEEPIRVVGRQAERPIHVARIHQLAQQGTPRRRDLHGLEQGQELVAVPSTCVFADRLAERTVLRLALPGEARAVGREERERRRGIGAVLREVEVHASNDVPSGVPRAQKRLQWPVELSQLGAARRAHRLPARGERGGVQVLAAHHRWRARGERLDLGFGKRNVQALAARVDLGHRAEVCDEGAAQIAPERKAWRQGRIHLRRAEVQEPVPGAQGKGRLDPRSGGGVERVGVGRRPERERTRRRQAEREAGLHGIPRRLAGQRHLVGASWRDCSAHTPPHRAGLMCHRRISRSRQKSSRNAPGRSPSAVPPIPGDLHLRKTRARQRRY